MQPLAGQVVEADGADHRLTTSVLAHQQEGPVQPDGDRRRRRVEVGQLILPVLLLVQGDGGDRVGHILDEGLGHAAAVVLGQVAQDTSGAELGVLVGDRLSASNRERASSVAATPASLRAA
jgi:hypothetical protein